MGSVPRALRHDGCLPYIIVNFHTFFFFFRSRETNIKGGGGLNSHARQSRVAGILIVSAVNEGEEGRGVEEEEGEWVSGC